MIDQRKTKPQETLEIKMNKQWETFQVNPTINLYEEGKWLLAVTSLEATNSVFNITNENNSLSITRPGHWNSKTAGKTIDDLKKHKSLGLKMIINYIMIKLEKKG